MIALALQHKVKNPNHGSWGRIVFGLIEDSQEGRSHGVGRNFEGLQDVRPHPKRQGNGHQGHLGVFLSSVVPLGSKQIPIHFVQLAHDLRALFPCDGQTQGLAAKTPGLLQSIQHGRRQDIFSVAISLGQKVGHPTNLLSLVFRPPKKQKVSHR